jgi:RNA-directed DNA polymerase
VDRQVSQAVWRFLKRSHPNKSSKWIYAKYCRRDPAQQGRKALSFQHTEVKSDGAVITKTTCLKAAATTKRVWHLKVRGKANPYEPTDRPYFKWLRGLRKLIKAGKWKPKWNAGWGS